MRALRGTVLSGRLARFTYTVLTVLAVPLLFLHLAWRARRQPEYLQHVGERFGWSPRLRGGAVIWIHAVSVGETRASQPLAHALHAQFPEHVVCFTYTTPTGRATAHELFADAYGEKFASCYLPYDYPWAVRSFLARVRPVIGILMETEVWPNLVQQCQRADIPLVLANARLSDKSLRKGLRWLSLMQPAVAGLTCILAQTKADAERIMRIGAIKAAKVSVTGNLKFDVTPPANADELGKEFRRRLGPRPVLALACTREGEEALLLDALPQALKLLPENILLLLIPRHPQRFDAVAALLLEHAITMQRRSDNQPVPAQTLVWLGDSMGELSAYYSVADVAFVGGSLMPLGSHNLIEASAVGCPVLIGPSTYNFAQVASDALAAGAAIQVRDAVGLFARAADLFNDPDERHAMAARALAFSSAHRGATARMVAELVPMIAGGKRNIA